VASSPDNDETGRHLQTARARQARRDGTRVQKPVVEPPQGQNRLEPGGHGPERSARPAMARRLRSSLHGAGLGGHEEGLRRTHGDAAGEKLGASPVERSAVNVGTIPISPSPPPSQVGAGQARCRLSRPGWGGALVVVRGREAVHMAKGGSKFAALGVECQEVGGEHRRTVAHACRGQGAGTEDPDQAAPMGHRRPTITVDSMTCTTWCMTRPSWCMPGAG
jgi:hypothetical protein